MIAIAVAGRTCTRCGEWKEGLKFKRVLGTNRLRSHCRVCNVADTRERREQQVERVCVKCEAVYQTRNGESACCEPCGTAARLANLTNPPKTTLVCKQCGKEHQPDHLSRQFCSRACKGVASRNKATAKRGKKFPEQRRAAVRGCLTCGTQFPAVKDTRRVQQIYCSHRCYLSNRRVSHFENRVMAFLESAGVAIDRTVKLGGWTFDGRISGSAILIEADGEYWHSSDKVRDRDRRKNEWCEANGFTLYRVLELAFYRDPQAATDVILKRAEAEGLSVVKES